MKLSQLSLADYNQLDSIPVINQDLSASGFTPVANTYYRHTGATTDTFTQGVIYLYDTAYHKLGESSSGGTTLNQYITSVDTRVSSNRDTLYRILKNAKKISYIRNSYTAAPVSFALNTNNQAYVFLSWFYILADSGLNNCVLSYNTTSSTLGGSSSKIATTTSSGTTITVSTEFSTSALHNFVVTYENDTEIT